MWICSARIKLETYFELVPDRVIPETLRVISDVQTFLTFDIDALNPVYAPGTGTPEAQRTIRGLRD